MNSVLDLQPLLGHLPPSLKILNIFKQLLQDFYTSTRAGDSFSYGIQGPSSMETEYSHPFTMSLSTGKGGHWTTKQVEGTLQPPKAFRSCENSTVETNYLLTRELRETAKIQSSLGFGLATLILHFS